MATQTLTILLADLVGSSTHLTSVPQKQAVEYLQDATLPIREIIEDHEGIVIKFTGDGYLAAFESWRKRYARVRKFAIIFCARLIRRREFRWTACA
jgi:class 3 adenylate cyclase